MGWLLLCLMLVALCFGGLVQMAVWVFGLVVVDCLCLWVCGGLILWILGVV